jgi:hypothetical protein
MFIWSSQDPHGPAHTFELDSLDVAVSEGSFGRVPAQDEGHDAVLIGDPHPEKAGSDELSVEARFHEVFIEGGDTSFVLITMGIRFGGKVRAMQPTRAFLHLLLLLPTLAGAQTPDLATRQAAVQTLSDSEWVRLSSPTFGRLEGRILEHTAAELVLGTGPQPMRIPATSIDTLWTRARPSRTGAIVGALAGTVIGVLIATGTVERGESPGTDYLLVFGVGGAVGGGLLGALVGKAFPSWHRRYPP